MLALALKLLLRRDFNIFLSVVIYKHLNAVVLHITKLLGIKWLCHIGCSNQFLLGANTQLV